jgi:hypothetical protein
MEPFVCVHLFGGLGNQLFQYAAAKAVRKNMPCKLLLNKETCNAHNTNGHNYAKELFTNGEEMELPPHPDYLFRSMGITVYSQSNGFEEWDPSQIQLPCILRGYFQFYPALQAILPDLRTQVIQALKIQNQNPNHAFLHVRRGDYVEKSDFHYLQGEEYYTKAYAKLCDLRKNVGPPLSLFVFSDDIAWCKSQSWLQLPGVEFVEEKDEVKSLAIMVSCTGGAILANSTFSWWAAILSDTPYVVYPTKWIAQKIEVLFPENWISL